MCGYENDIENQVLGNLTASTDIRVSLRGLGIGQPYKRRPTALEQGDAKAIAEIFTSLSRSSKSFLLPDFGKLLFSNSTFKSTTRNEEIGFPPTQNSRLSAIFFRPL